MRWNDGIHWKICDGFLIFPCDAYCDDGFLGIMPGTEW